MKSKNIINSFKYAIQGIISSIRSERNIKIHIGFMILTIILGVIFNINTLEWIICIILFALVIGAELFNTAIEKTIDIIVPNKDNRAKFIKDVSAGAVLIFAIAALIIGIIIFIPKILNFLEMYI